MHIASSRAVRRKRNLLVLDGAQLIAKALLCGIIPNAIYCGRLRDINSQLSATIVSSGAKLYQLSPQQMKLARDEGIVSSLFGDCFISLQLRFSLCIHMQCHTTGLIAVLCIYVFQLS